MIYNQETFAERLRQDDRTVIDEIYALYHHRIFRFSMAYLKNEEDAYDIVQEVFVTMWENRLVLRKDTNFDAYLFTVAKNSVLSLFRKRVTEQKYMEYLSQAATSNTVGTEEQTDYTFLKERYEQLIEQLPPKRKEIFKLSREKGLSNKEIAAMRGITEKTVEDHLSKALFFFKQHLGSFGIWTALFYFLFVE
ncbi:RNA polymerase sigma-70 factor [Microbacter margulisiae]|uniref:RNA polymerase sigma-70 factor (ECF subfamily) n=1 Tax=Microbacter margulisiae TaxID=1350067 RepID=A0A7W5DP41_9PORP|nr:RNA polymerase sigma-70 factor [Microbacter margulisiae]MBB3186195.1 RNA polymerase sigma-70 factor (ECF subfamily) [Microbacter margulisiae]